MKRFEVLDNRRTLNGVFDGTGPHARPRDLTNGIGEKSVQPSLAPTRVLFFESIRIVKARYRAHRPSDNPIQIRPDSGRPVRFHRRDIRRIG